MEIHPGRGSASKSFSVYFFIVLEIFARFRAFFCVLVGFCTFLRVFTCFSPLGALLERSWALLERSWGALGTLLGALGSSWGALGALLERS